MSEPESSRERTVSRILRLALLAVVVFCLVASAISINQKAWEHGVFWGAEAVRGGANYSNQLEEAYRLNREAGDRVKADKKRLNQYRPVPE